METSSSQPSLILQPGRRNFIVTGATALFAATASGRALAQFGPEGKLDVPYVPTPMPVVQKMLEMGEVTKDDLLYDLGCGDGRIVSTAAKERGARGVGIDLDPDRIKEAQAYAKTQGVTDRVKFMQADLFKSDFSPATVVTLYLLDSVNQRLRPQLWKQLKVGTRVVSHDFSMGSQWPPERTERVGNSTIYRWTITEAHKRA